MGLLESLGVKKLVKEPTKITESFSINSSGNIGLDNPISHGMPEGNYIGDSFFDNGGVFGKLYNNPGTKEIEKSYIIQQRVISGYPEVAIGIVEIMKDLYVMSDPLNLKIDIPDNFEKESDIKKIYNEFDKFKQRPFSVVGNIHTPKLLLMYNLLKQCYIDGHLCVYAVKVPIKPSDDISHIQNLNDVLFEKKKAPQFFESTNIKTHAMLDSILENTKKSNDKSKIKENEELVFIPLDPTRINVINGEHYYNLISGSQVKLNDDLLIMADFGLYDVMGARYGYLQYAFKYANQLQSLQDMLIPMRFRRSIARRIFNVDVGNLPNSRATEVMQDTQRKFKYKKSYDVKNGRIVANDNEQVGIVEDYWFANRSGSKGTTVEMMDEAGNFADSLEDITYFNKKLYQSMFIPLRRIFESEADYDYTSSNIEVDELRFNSFLSIIRFTMDSVFTKMFQIYLMINCNFDKKLVENCSVHLRYDNWFEKHKKLEKFERALDVFESSKEVIGTVVSAETAMDTIFEMTPEDVKKEINKIKSELDKESIYFFLYNSIKQEE